jgi:hypothetical protein
MDPALAVLVDRRAIVDTVGRYAQTLDARDWTAASARFADEVAIDYSDLRGTGPQGRARRLARTAEGSRITCVKQVVAWNRGNPAAHAGVRPAGGPP